MFSHSDIIEMQRLYEVEQQTLQQIAKRFNITKQGVHYHLLSVGVEMRARTKSIQVPFETIYRLYVTEGLSSPKVGLELGICDQTVRKLLGDHGIPVRRKGVQPSTYAGISKLEINESLIFPRPAKGSLHVLVHAAAKRNGIKIVVKKISANEFRVTRVS